MCSKKLGIKGLLDLVINVTFPSLVTLKMPNCNYDIQTNLTQAMVWMGEGISNFEITRKRYQSALATENFWWLDM